MRSLCSCSGFNWDDNVSSASALLSILKYIIHCCPAWQPITIKKYRTWRRSANIEDFVGYQWNCDALDNRNINCIIISATRTECAVCCMLCAVYWQSWAQGNVLSCSLGFISTINKLIVSGLDWWFNCSPTTTPTPSGTPRYSEWQSRPSSYAISMDFCWVVKLSLSCLVT